MKFYPEILNKSQKELLAQIGLMDKSGFYLAGGTALALQIGHRTSLDFDFYTDNHFDSPILINNLKKQFTDNIEVKDDQSKDTLFAQINGIKFSAFYYPYKLISKLIEYPPIRITSMEDISAMKVAAIVQRGKRRDFIDFYYLLETFGLANILAFSYQKYPWYKEMDGIIFTSLTHFKDADNDGEDRGITVLDKDFSWDKCKKKIAEKVKEYQQSI